MSKVKIYQLNLDNLNKMFLSYESIMRGYGEVDLDWYDCVYTYNSDVDTEDINLDTLDKIYYKFNLYTPEDFRGHSISVSDIIDINGNSFFCDRFGWKVI